MSAFELKVLWTVKMPSAAAEQQLLHHAITAGCDAVAIRTSNSQLAGAIGRFHAAGLKVFGWRWPAKEPTTSPANYYAIDQAHFVAETLIPAGLDGFYADIESDNDKKSNDWDDAALAPLAREFCAIIRAAAPKWFELSLTAGCMQPTGNPHIPWAQFAEVCDAVAPQSYWRRVNDETGLPQDIHGGTPSSSFSRAMQSWSKRFPGKPVEPIMGELAVITPSEIAEFGSLMQANGVRRIHVAASDRRPVALHHLICGAAPQHRSGLVHEAGEERVRLVVSDTFLLVDAAVQRDVYAEGQQSHVVSLR